MTNLFYSYDYFWYVFGTKFKILCVRTKYLIDKLIEKVGPTSMHINFLPEGVEVAMHFFFNCSAWVTLQCHPLQCTALLPQAFLFPYSQFFHWLQID